MSYVDGAKYFNGTPIVLNSSLQQSGPVWVPQVENVLIDPHEFQLTEDDSSLVQTLITTKLPGSGETVLAGGFYEIDRLSGSIMFEWSSVDHIGMNETFIDERSDDAPLDYL